jgi:hypothetical protein
MKYSLLDWYEWFPVRSLFVRLLEDALETRLEHVTDHARADVILVSAFGRQHQRRDIQELGKAWKIYITGEPADADYRYVHHSLTFDPLDYEGRNHRFQHWLHEFYWYDDIDSVLTRAETEEMLATNRPLASYRATLHERQRRVITVFSKCENRRVAMYEALRRRGLIDGIGMPFGGTGKHEFRDKCDRIAGYRMNQCFENRVYHGYYTEKVLHARAVACVPLTWADRGIAMDYEPAALINILDFICFDDIVAHVEAVLGDDARTAAYVDQPVFTVKPSLAPTIGFLRRSYEKFRAGDVPHVGESLLPHDAPPVRRGIHSRIRSVLGRVARRIGG